MESVPIAKESDAEAAQENNSRVLSLCDLQGSSWSQTSANLQPLLFLLAGPAVEQGAGGAVATTLQHPRPALGRTEWRVMLPPAQRWDGTHSTAPSQSTRAVF